MMPLPPPAPPEPSFLRSGSANTHGGITPDRSALLTSIQLGTKLKKTITSDRSAPLIEGVANAVTSANDTLHSSGSSSGFISNGGIPHLGGLFSGGMPRLRPTGMGRTRNVENSLGMKSAAPILPKSSTQKQINHSSSSVSGGGCSETFCSNGFLPPSPKPSIKSTPAPPPPPANQKPSYTDRTTGWSTINELPTKPAPPRPLSDLTCDEEKHPPLPLKPSLQLRTDAAFRGAPPPRPPSSAKPHLPPKSPDLKPNCDGPIRRSSIDRSKSMREPAHSNFFPQTRIGTSAESPAAPYRPTNNHREAPPVPSFRPLISRTVGRATGSKMVITMRHPSEKPPKPPQRPVIAAPPPPSQPPPPPPPGHREDPSSELSYSGQQQIPPLPPERNESAKSFKLAGDVAGGEFESRFLSMFKPRQQLPFPLSISNSPKIYPSKNNVKNQRQAPQPPMNNNGTPAYAQGGPPFPPPHQPIHLQMEKRFFGAETSSC